MPPSRIAVVGSGVAGLTAAHVASRTAHVTLYEADSRPGGHADTHTVVEDRPGGAVELGIDTGFIVHNPRTYPVLLRMFAELGVATQESEMSMSISDAETGLEWAGALGRRGLFPNRDNLRRPAYLRMLVEIPRFHARAKRLLAAEADNASATWTLREFLADGGFSAYFTRHFMEPLVAAVWSCDPEVALDYPARYLFTFLQHHGMLGVFGSPQWRTVTGGSRSYVERVVAGLQEVRLGAKVTSVLETADGVEVTDGNGETSTYDAVVIATHPGQALGMLADPTPAQRELLTAMPYSPNTALLHTDTSLLPAAVDARASWNFHRPSTELARSRTQAGRSRSVGAGPSSRGDARHVSRPTDQPDAGDVAVAGGDGVVVTYDLTRLQRLDTDVHYLVSLGAEHLVDPALVIERMEYEHPLYNPTSVAAQARLREADTDRVVLAGAYHGWGFHEDGARSGLEAVTRLGLPWPEVTTTPPELEAARTGIYATTITHTRRQPWRRTFTHRSHTWLVDLDDLPDHGVLGRFEGRDHLDGRDHPERSIRANLAAYLRLHDPGGRDVLDGGRVLMAAHPRALGHCFNPITVFWCWDRQGRRLPSVVEVHNTYGDRHAYLVEPDGQGRARTDKELYVSPFHGTDGSYDLAVPLPTDRLDVAVTLRTDDGATFSASLRGRHDPTTTPLRAAPEALRGALLIRLHGVWLWARRLRIHPRPPHHQEGVQ